MMINSLSTSSRNIVQDVNRLIDFITNQVKDKGIVKHQDLCERLDPIIRGFFASPIKDDVTKDVFYSLKNKLTDLHPDLAAKVSRTFSAQYAGECIEEFEELDTSIPVNFFPEITREQDLEHLMRRVPRALLKLVDKTIRDRFADIEALCDVLKDANWDEHPIFSEANQKEFPLLALAAVKMNKLSVIDFSSVALYASLIKLYGKSNIQKMDLFNRDLSVNEETRSHLIKTMQFVKKLQMHGDLSNELTKKQFFQFYNELRRCSPIHHQIWIVKDIEGPPVSYDPSMIHLLAMNGKISISQRIATSVGLNIFSRLTGRDAGKRMVGQISLVQAFLNAKCPFPVKLMPIIGTAFAEDLAWNGLTDSRLVSVPFPFEGCENFEHADFLSLKEKDHDMTYHDAIYHGYLVSFIPPIHRKYLIKMGEGIFQTLRQQEYRHWESIAVRIANRFFDMEFARYAFNGNNLSLSERFFYGINNIFEPTNGRIFAHKAYALKKRLKRDFTSSDLDEIWKAVDAEFGPKQHILNEKQFRVDVIKHLLRNIEPLKQLSMSPEVVFPDLSVLSMKQHRGEAFSWETAFYQTKL